MLQKPCPSADDIPSQSAEDGANVRKLLAPIHRTGVALRSGDSIPPTTAFSFAFFGSVGLGRHAIPKLVCSRRGSGQDRLRQPTTAG